MAEFDLARYHADNLGVINQQEERASQQNPDNPNVRLGWPAVQFDGSLTGMYGVLRNFMQTMESQVTNINQSIGQAITLAADHTRRMQVVEAAVIQAAAHRDNAGTDHGKHGM